MCTRYPIINRVSELKVHIELTRFVQPEKIEIDANERAVNEKSQYCFFVCTTFDSFLNDFLVRGYIIMVVKYKGQKLRYVKDFHGKEVLWILSPEQIEMPGMIFVGGYPNEYCIFMDTLSDDEQKKIRK